jgi:hypothetical protein
MISVARPIKRDAAALTRDLRELAAALQDETNEIRPLLQRVVPTFHQHESNT